MSSPHYADHVWHGPVTVEENVRLARDTYRIRFACPEIARRIVPGQFVILTGALATITFCPRLQPLPIFASRMMWQKCQIRVPTPISQGWSIKLDG